ncbi:MAG: 2,3-bisphosphoglycerate-independent phosphoglycerate mutase [Clostridia bacterium]|nr:2,3-bisphosphoglycerate-independent phosphoglycerate mutase [Clostridia bacterium]
MNKGILVILDGYGEGKAGEYNAVINANTPTLDRLKTQSYSLLEASGEAVGLFTGDLGGSEVGHTTIGAGRVVPSTAKKINDEVNSGEIAKNVALNKILDRLNDSGGDLHLVGLMSDKNIHSNINHAIALVDIAKDRVANIYLHLITDGRDCAPYESIRYYNQVREHIDSIDNCHVLSISGRAWAMDRENHFDRTIKATGAMFGITTGIDESYIESYLSSEHRTKNDQFIEPIHIDIEQYHGIKNADCILFFNFREDRLRQIAKVCSEYGCEIATMSDVGGIDSIVLYPQTNVDHTLSEYLSKLGLRQLKIGESTKYAHVTYFLNGGVEDAFIGEDRVHVPSHNVEDFSSTPEMKASEIATETIKAIDKDYDAIIVNFSNADMVGHTGDYIATKKSIEAMDQALARILDKAKERGYFVMVTADHGNAEEMRLDNGESHMAHTLNPVFCVVADSDYVMTNKGGLRDIAPTFIELLGLPKYPYFEGHSLIR